MWKSKRFIIVAVLVVVMAIGGTAGIALAQDGNDGEQGRRGALLARVAEIAGVDQQVLEDAFKQAQKEMREEALDMRLQKLVDEGRITQEEANAYKSWLQSKPDVRIPLPQRTRAPRMQQNPMGGLPAPGPTT